MMTVTPLREGWAELPTESFYPPDLPVDWQLTYYANELDALLLPWGWWLEADQVALEGFAAGRPPGLKVFVEDHAAMSLSRWEQLSAALGGSPAGLISRGATALSERSWCECRYRPPMASPGGSSAASAGLVCEPSSGVASDLQAAAAWLAGLSRAYPDRSIVVPLGRCEIQLVQRWQAMLDLLGCAR